MLYSGGMKENINNQNQKSFSQEVRERNQEINTTRHSALLYKALGATMLVGAGYLYAKGQLETPAVFGVGGLGMIGFGELQSRDARNQQEELDTLRARFLNRHTVR